MPIDEYKPVGDYKFAPSLNNIVNLEDPTGKRLGNPDRVGLSSYKQHASPFYRNYPGGFEGKVAEAKKYRNIAKPGPRNFDKKEDPFLAPRLEPWILNRKNLMLEFDEELQDGDEKIGGYAYIDKMQDARGRRFSPAATFGQISAVNKFNNRWRKDPDVKHGAAYWGITPTHAMSEEMTHGAQPPGATQRKDTQGVFGEKGGLMPYGAINIEAGAKLTNAVQNYILKQWGYGDRRDSFNETDARILFRQILKSPDDKGLSDLIHNVPKGKEYLKSLEDEAVKFMMSTAQTEPKRKDPSGFPYAPTRMRA